MLFTSLEFLLFLSVVMILYFTIPKNYRWIVLLISSIFFYCIAGIKFIPFILVTTLTTFLTAQYISDQNSKLEKELTKLDSDKIQKKELKEKYKRKCKRVMVVALVISLGILCYSKFTNMLMVSIQNIVNSIGVKTVQMPKFSLIVPLGISYYTFSSIGYVLDVYWKRYEAENNIFKYLLYISFFPHIVQGPIARYNRLAPQLFEGHVFDEKRISFGMQLIIWGFFKKLVVADRLAIFVNTVYNNVNNNKGFLILIATIFYSIQLYADFSGCVDIARGIAQIFGITLDDNFRQPYFSKSAAEFWRRWHISLGNWFKDYLYMPVSVSGFVKKYSKKVKEKHGNQAGKNVITVLSLGVVWLATGIWHGTGWNYVVWGIWHGSLIIFSSLLDKRFECWKQKLHIVDSSRSWQVFMLVRTFILTAIIPRIITRAGSIPNAIQAFKSMFAQFNIWVFFDESLYQLGLNRKNFQLALFCIVIMLIVSIMKEKGIQIREKIAEQNIVLRWGIYYLALFSVIIFGIYGPGYEASSFVYMNF